MSTTEITWVIEKIQVVPQLNEHANVVRVVTWRANAVNGEYTATTNGIVELPTPTNGFTEYADLTPEQVLGWVKDTLTPTQVEFTETILKSMINNQMKPPVIDTPLPWNSTGV